MPKIEKTELAELCEFSTRLCKFAVKHWPGLDWPREVDQLNNKLHECIFQLMERDGLITEGMKTRLREGLIASGFVMMTMWQQSRSSGHRVCPPESKS